MKSTFGSGLTHTTPFPNVLIDDVMPRLKDTQWRLLCVIVRQTLGWYDDVSGLRKDRDWLTRSQLKARTGRNSEAIAVAIDALVKCGYITAQNSKGILLLTPQDRRKNHGRIYYGLTAYWRNRIGLNEHRKTEQLPILAGSISHVNSRKTKHIPARKSNTTKETETKEIQINDRSEMTISQNVLSFIETFLAKAQENRKKQPDIKLASDVYNRLNCWLTKIKKEDQVLVLQKYFCSNHFYIVRQEYSLHAFVNTCNILHISKK